MKMTSIEKGKMDLDDFKNLIIFTEFKNLVDKKSPFYVRDVLIRALVISAFNVSDIKSLKDFSLYSLYMIDKNRYEVLSYEKLFIEVIQPINYENKDINIEGINNNIRKCRIAMNETDDIKKIAELKKKVRWYENIRMYYTCGDSEIQEYNKEFIKCENFYKEREREIKVEKETKLLKQNQVTDTKEEKREKELINIEKKAEELRESLTNNTFDIYCPKCKEKVIPTQKRLKTMNTKKGTKKMIIGICPVHGSKISRIVSPKIEISDIIKSQG